MLKSALGVGVQILTDPSVLVSLPKGSDGRPADVGLFGYGGIRGNTVAVDTTIAPILGVSSSDPTTALRAAERHKIQKYDEAVRNAAGMLRFVPFAVSESGSLASHAEAFLADSAPNIGAFPLTGGPPIKSRQKPPRRLTSFRLPVMNPPAYRSNSPPSSVSAHRCSGLRALALALAVALQAVAAHDADWARHDGSYHRDKSFSYIRAYNGGANAPTWDERACSSSGGGFPPELASVRYTEHCVKRSYFEAFHEPARAEDGALGVVVVVCKEQLGWLRSMGCDNTHLYIYSKCGRGSRTIQRDLGPLQECASIIDAPDTVWSTLTNTKMHSVYLRHIADRYDHLEPNLLFLKGNFMYARGQRHLNTDVESVWREAKEGKWEFKSLGSWRSVVGTHFDKNPFHPGSANYVDTANDTRWGEELCTLYRRYTCEAECYTCHNCQAPVCFQSQSKGMFMVSARRVWSLPRSEYVWLRQWLNSWDAEGIQRRFMMDTLWSALFGCEEDGHSRATVSGCWSGMGWGMKQLGYQIAPPRQFIESGAVRWPPEEEGDGVSAAGRLGAPMVPPSAEGETLTFVAVAPVAEGEALEEALQRVTLSFLSALMSHPDGQLVLLHAPGTAPQVTFFDYWEGKLEVREVQAPVWGLHSTPLAYTFALQLHYLMELAAASQPPGPLVMLSSNVLLGRSLTPALRALGDAAGVVLRSRSDRQSLTVASETLNPSTLRTGLGPSRHSRRHHHGRVGPRGATTVSADTSLWLVPAAGARRTAALLASEWARAQHAAATGEASRAMEALGGQLVEAVAAPQPALKGLPCDLFAGHVGGGAGAHPDQVCRPSKASFGLRMANSTQMGLVWSWMQSRGSASFGVAKAYHSLLPQAHRMPKQAAYEHLLLATGGEA
eukprot:jgi/Tetstr1/430556/TSEL_020354.t1